MMKKFILIIVSLFALTAFAGEASGPTDTSVTPKSIKILPKKSKRQLKALYQYKNFAKDNNDDYGPPDSDELDLHRAYSQPKITDLTNENFGVSANIAARLRLARQLAITRYKEVWCGG